MITFKVKDNSDKINELENEAVNKILMVWGNNIVNNTTDVITEQSIVDTGRLRQSISFITPTTSGGNVGMQEGDNLNGKAPDKCVVVGSNVDYAFFVHEGTSKMQGRPFLTQGIGRSDLEKIVEGVLKNGSN